MKPSVSPSSKTIPFPSWLGWSALVAAAAFALIATICRAGQSRLASRARLAEQETRLAQAELRATRNQLEAERILASAQADQWRRADAEAAILREKLGSTGNSTLAGLRITVLTTPPGKPSDAQGAVAWDPTLRQGLLTVSKLPVPGDDQNYQLWIVADPRSWKPRPVDGGVFSVDPANGAARLVFSTGTPISADTAFFVSRERKDGSSTTEGPVVLGGG